MTAMALAILCLARADESGDQLRSEVDEVTGQAVTVEVVADEAALELRLAELGDDGIRVPLVLATDRVGDRDGIAVLEELGRRSQRPGIRTLLVTHRPHAADDAVGTGAISAFVSAPPERRALGQAIGRLVTGHLLDQDPSLLARMSDVVDVELLARALAESEERRRATRSELHQARRGMLDHTHLSQGEVETAMVEEIDRVLDHPQRRVYPAGSLLLESGRPVDGVTIMLDGRVTLFLEVDGTETPFHVRTAGRILGILALAHHEPAFFGARAVSDVTVIPLSVEQLELALQRSSTLGGLFVSVQLRSMVRRIRRSVELRLRLNAAQRLIAAERDRLAAALQELDQAQTQLVAQEKMALLGQLVAGVAHELNNPVAAILRATEFIEQDVTSLTQRHPESQLLAGSLLGALRAQPTSARTQRAQRRELASVLGDDALAGRLVQAGITTAPEADELFGDLPDAAREELLRSIEAYRRLGTAIRNLRSGGQRIEGLVNSLRSSARASEDLTPGVELREGLDETLMLLEHRMGEVDVKRRYGPVPTIEARPGELCQVWTNLVVNAIQVLDGRGRIEVATDVPEPGLVRVQVIDNGPGISADDIERVFDLQFTTKQGRVDFGLGLGLRLAHDIVARHHGEISVESEPGRTAFSVILPETQDPSGSRPHE